MNPQPTHIDLFLSENKVSLSFKDHGIVDHFIKGWNKNVKFEFSYDQPSFTLHLTIPEVDRKAKGNGKLILTNEIGNSKYNFDIHIICPNNDSNEFCDNGGTCIYGDTFCDCSKTEYYGENCEHSVASY